MSPSSRRFSLAVLAICAAAMLAIALFVASVDPYWLWRERVAWGYNPALENRMRFAKSLQVLLRRPDVVLLGSSVVYRGIDPDDVRGTSTYNLGIASLRIREAEAYVRYLLRWTRPQRIVLGVDYFAFDRLQRFEAGFDPALAEAGYLAKAGFGAFASAMALSDAWRLTRGKRADDDGSWHRNGYKSTRPRTPEEIAQALQMTRQIFSKSDIASSELAALERIIELARREKVALSLFVPPYHRSWMEASDSARRSGLSFDEWLRELTALSTRHGVELWDFANANPLATAPVGEGSRYYLDPSHFSPLVGRWILHRLGLNARTDDAPPEQFGRRVPEIASSSKP